MKASHPPVLPGVDQLVVGEDIMIGYLERGENQLLLGELQIEDLFFNSVGGSFADEAFVVCTGFREQLVPQNNLTLFLTIS